MRVLKGKILVTVRAASSSDLVGDLVSRRGTVHVSGSDQVDSGADILFGESFEEIRLEKDSTKRYYLMKEENIKIIYDDDTTPPAQGNVLPFFRESA